MNALQSGTQTAVKSRQIYCEREVRCNWLEKLLQMGAHTVVDVNKLSQNVLQKKIKHKNVTENGIDPW